MARIAINGLGRIGKLLLRALIDQGVQPHEICLLNDAVGTPELHAHLLEFFQTEPAITVLVKQK